MKHCSIDNCFNKYKGRGYCEKHLRKLNRYGHPLGSRPPSPTCSVDGCKNIGNRRGLCNLHRQRKERHGSALAIVRPREIHHLRHTNIYETWKGMKQRCQNPKHISYKYYGARGVTVHEAWIISFSDFYNYVSKLNHFGEAGYTLDRKDNNGNYEPGNVRWATHSEQRLNQRKV